MITAPPSELVSSIALNTATFSPLKNPSSRINVALIPWDPDSPAHQERLRLQRKACGWKYEQVWIDRWSKLQKEGKIALQWLVSGLYVRWKSF